LQQLAKAAERHAILDPLQCAGNCHCKIINLGLSTVDINQTLLQQL